LYRISNKAKLIILIALCIGIVIGSVAIGTVRISVWDSVKIIFSQIPLLGKHISIEGIEPSYTVIVMSLRLPRILLALLAGMGLAASGCVYQGIFSNPMADPYLIGISSGAALGATISMLLPIPEKYLQYGPIGIFAFIGALLVMVFVFSISRHKGKLPAITMILAGIAVNYFISSIIALLMLFNKEALESVYFWTLGSFKYANSFKIITLFVVVAISLIIIQKYNQELNMIMLNEEQAISLGVSTEKIKKKLLIISSLMVSLIVAFCGVIGFVGLIIPHGVRIIFGANHKILIPASIFAGGGFTVFSDTLARSILSNSELSVGIITAIFGVPFFLLLIYKNKKSIA